MIVVWYVLKLINLVIRLEFFWRSELVLLSGIKTIRKMLQIRLKKVPSSESGGAVKPLPVETVTVACPDHLVLADLPVAKGIGAATAASLVKTVGRRSRRQLGERVHFCVRCDYPIAIYGRLVCSNYCFLHLFVVVLDIVWTIYLTIT